MSTKSMRRMISAAFLSLCLPLTAAAQTAAKGIEFHVLPLANTHQQLDTQMRMEMRMKVLPKPDISDAEREKLAATIGKMPSPIVMNSKLTQRIDTSAADKQGLIKVQSEALMGMMEMQLGAGGPVQTVPNPLGDMRFSAVLNKGRYEDVKFSEAMGKALPGMDANALFAKMFNAMAPLEGAVLKPGETIELPFQMDMPLPGVDASALSNKTVARYTLRKVEKGVADFDVSATLDMKLDATMPAPAASAASEPQAAPAPFKLTAKGQGKGLLRMRLADRLMLLNTLDFNAEMEMPMPDGNLMQMQMRMVVDLKGKTVKKR